MEDNKLTEEVLKMKGEFDVIKESHTSFKKEVKEDIVNLKSDVKRLYESDNCLNINVAKLDGSIKNLSQELSSSIDSLKNEISSGNKETTLIFQSAFEKMESDRQLSNKDIQFLLDREKKREEESDEDKKALKDIKWSTLKTVLVGVASSIVPAIIGAILLWLGFKGV